MRTDLANADIQLAQVQPGEVQFNAQLSKVVAELHTYVPEALAWVQTLEQALPVLPTLLGVGTPTNYLIEVLDSTELRPGGFIGNYGCATLLKQVQNNRLIIGYWVLDDWVKWDAGSARLLLIKIHQLIQRYTPGRPAICGFGGSIGLYQGYS